jgi:hypothetical protein
MKKILLISLSMLFAGEMEVDGDLNVSGDIQSPTIQELQAQILALQSQSSGVIPYEPFNTTIMLSEFPMFDSYINFHQFHSPSTGQYNFMRIFTTPTSSNNYSGTLTALIYSDIPGNPGTPSLNPIAMGQVTFVDENLDLSYINIQFDTPVNLIANNRYWAALSVNNNTSSIICTGFHNDYQGIYNIVKYQTNSNFEFQAQNLVQGEYAFWFRIY